MHEGKGNKIGSTRHGRNKKEQHVPSQAKKGIYPREGRAYPKGQKKEGPAIELFHGEGNEKKRKERSIPRRTGGKKDGNGGGMGGALFAGTIQTRGANEKEEKTERANESMHRGA